MKFFLTFILVAIFVTLGILTFVKVIFPYYSALLKKKFLPNQAQKECDEVLSEQKWRNRTDYFWSAPIRFVWITIGLLFLSALSASLGGIVGIFLAILFTLVLVYFLNWAYKSHEAYPKKAKAQLDAFEKAIEESIKKEISFEGDNIQRFSNEDSEFDTAPKIFKFPVETAKLEYPVRSGKMTIISEQKLEFLILSREYLSICQGATKFNLFSPARGDVTKKCAEVKGAGECHEYYYSLIKNVKYEGGAIKIISHSGEEMGSFKCKKDPAAMKALHEKLRLTERQRLKKIEEQYRYENIKEKRNQETENKS